VTVAERSCPGRAEVLEHAGHLTLIREHITGPARVVRLARLVRPTHVVALPPCLVLCRLPVRGCLARGLGVRPPSPAPPTPARRPSEDKGGGSSAPPSAAGRPQSLRCRGGPRPRVVGFSSAPGTRPPSRGAAGRRLEPSSVGNRAGDGRFAAAAAGLIPS